MFANKMIVDNFPACCCSHYAVFVASNVRSFKKIMKQSVLKRLKTKEKCMLTKHLNE